MPYKSMVGLSVTVLALMALLAQHKNIYRFRRKVSCDYLNVLSRSLMVDSALCQVQYDTKITLIKTKSFDRE